MEAVLWRDGLNLSQQLSSWQDSAVSVHSLYRVPERYLLLVVFRVEETACEAKLDVRDVERGRKLL